MVGRAASHRGVIICSSFGRRVVGENPPSRERRGEKMGAGGGSVAERGCMQTAVRGGPLTPFIHPFLVKPGDARGIGGSFQGFDGSSRQKGWRSRDARGTATASVVPVRQCDPELAASRSIPGSLSYPPASHPPPSPPPPASHPSSLSLCARASSFLYLVSSDPKERGRGRGGGGHHKTPRRFPRGSRYTSPGS